MVIAELVSYNTKSGKQFLQHLINFLVHLIARRTVPTRKKSLSRPMSFGDESRIKLNAAETA